MLVTVLCNWASLGSAKWLKISILFLNESQDFSHGKFLQGNFWRFVFVTPNSNDLTTRNRAGTRSREPAQPACPLGKSSFPPFQRMLPPLRNLHQRALQASQPMAHTHPMARSTWSTLCWLSCKCWSKVIVSFCICVKMCSNNLLN